MKIKVEKLENLLREMKFATRGVTFSKRMWREGYNRALFDIGDKVREIKKSQFEQEQC